MTYRINTPYITIGEISIQLYTTVWINIVYVSIFRKVQVVVVGQLKKKKKKTLRQKSRKWHNHKPHPFPDTKRKKKQTKPKKRKSYKRTKRTMISSLFPKRSNRNVKRTEKHKNKITQNKSPRRINHKATKSKTNTGTTALERSVE